MKIREAVMAFVDAPLACTSRYSNCAHLIMVPTSIVPTNNGAHLTPAAHRSVCSRMWVFSGIWEWKANIWTMGRLPGTVLCTRDARIDWKQTVCVLARYLANPVDSPGRRCDFLRP